MKFGVHSLFVVAALAITTEVASAQPGIGYSTPAGGTIVGAPVGAPVVGAVPVSPNFSGYLYPKYVYGSIGYSRYGSGTGPVPIRPVISTASPLYSTGSARPYASAYRGGYSRGNVYGRR